MRELRNWQNSSCYLKPRTSNDVLIPQDCVDYASNPYVLEALRLSKETGAGEAEWQVLLDELRARKG